MYALTTTLRLASHFSMEAATNSTACKQFKLPDLTLSCPFKYALNQNPKDIATASAAWISAYATEVFGERKRNAFPSSHLHNIAFHAYPYADAERLRTCCDFMNLLFFLDEVSDEMGGAEAFAIGNTFVRAMAGDDDALGDGSAVWRATRVRIIFPRVTYTKSDSPIASENASSMIRPLRVNVASWNAPRRTPTLSHAKPV